MLRVFPTQLTHTRHTYTQTRVCVCAWAKMVDPTSYLRFKHLLLLCPLVSLASNSPSAASLFFCAMYARARVYACVCVWGSCLSLCVRACVYVPARGCACVYIMTRPCVCVHPLVFAPNWVLPPLFFAHTYTHTLVRSFAHPLPPPLPVSLPLLSLRFPLFPLLLLSLSLPLSREPYVPTNFPEKKYPLPLSFAEVDTRTGCGW